MRSSGFAPGPAGKTHRWRHLGPGTNGHGLGKGGEEGELRKPRAVEGSPVDPLTGMVVGYGCCSKDRNAILLYTFESM